MNKTLDGLVPIIANSLGNITTSSNYSAEHGGNRCRLNFKEDPSKIYNNKCSEGWVPSINDNKQYLMVGTSIPTTFVAVGVQGRGDDDMYVTSYKIRYTLDGVNWCEYKCNGKEAIEGCYDRNSIKVHYFDPPIRARSISIVPLEWNFQIGLRCEFYAQPSVHTFVQSGQIDSGTDTLISTGKDVREVIVPVEYPVPFITTPKVCVCFDMIDCDSTDTQTRIEVYPKDVTNKGFNCVFKVWWLSRAWTLRADYIATSHE